MAKASDKAHPAEASKNPWDYLLVQGWTPLGNPKWETTLWRDPQGVQEASECLGQVKVRQDGEMKPLLRPSRVKKGAKVPVFQRVRIPAFVPVTLKDALLIQSKRDLVLQSA